MIEHTCCATEVQMLTLSFNNNYCMLSWTMKLLIVSYSSYTLVS